MTTQSLLNKTRLFDSVTVACCTIGSLLVALFSYAFSNEHLTLAIGSFSLIPPACLGLIAARRGGLLDPTAVFSLAYAAYNGLILARLPFVDVDKLIYPIPVDRTILLKAAVVSSIGTLGLVTGWLLQSGYKLEQSCRRSPVQCRVAFYTGGLFFLAGLFFYFLQYQQMGGYLNAVSMVRVERYEKIMETVSMPYAAFVSVGLALLFYASIGLSRRRMACSIFALSTWILLVGLQGDRRLILQSLMTVGVVLGVIRPKALKLRWKTVVGALVVLCAALLFGQFRSYFNVAADSGMSLREVASLAMENSSAEWLMPERVEFGGPYITVLRAAGEKKPLLLGESYYNSLFAFLPRAVYPGKKPLGLSQQNDTAVHQGSDSASGWGYNPAAEAYLNFGVVGVFLILGAWSMYFAWLGRVRYRGLAGVLFSSTLVHEALNVNRNDFRAVYLESFYIILVAAIGLACVAVMRWGAPHVSARRLGRYRLIQET